ncbi:hypothetical protein E2562_002520 [Oryza meyeriana var. granulata]|uniref:Uncharacterized protein n=1 Tax=Oryza meyeriana var. granulata TaxID=110450 RepID=A0A6G1F2R6_9ORYZ|nr:hypothetical protein E2562_002520 [Oryza meyeriana var. granulata]
MATPTRREGEDGVAGQDGNPKSRLMTLQAQVECSFMGVEQVASGILRREKKLKCTELKEVLA